MHVTQRGSSEIRLSMLDGFRIGPIVPSPSPASGWRIVAYLALRGPTPRQRIAGALWPEATQARAMGCLRSGVWRLQREYPRLIDARRGVLSLPDRVTTDIDRLVSLARSILERDAHIPEDFALLLPDNELTPEWHDEWVLVERERLRQLRLDALDTLATRLIMAHKTGLAMQAGLAALGTDPLRESSCQRVIQAHLLRGNVAQARHQYNAYADLLRRELGVDPSAGTRRLLSAEDRGRVLTG